MLGTTASGQFATFLIEHPWMLGAMIIIGLIIYIGYKIHIRKK